MPTSRARRLRTPDRWAVAARVVAAALGGYALANASGIFVATLLPMQRADAVFAATLASFAIYTGAVIYAFAARTAARACAGLVVPSAALGTVAWLLGPA